MCLKITEEDWILNWSKYNIYVKNIDLAKYSFFIIPTPKGTLAFGEYHYLNCSEVINLNWINDPTKIKITK